MWEEEKQAGIIGERWRVGAPPFPSAPQLHKLSHINGTGNRAVTSECYSVELPATGWRMTSRIDVIVFRIGFYRPMEETRPGCKQ